MTTYDTPWAAFLGRSLICFSLTWKNGEKLCDLPPALKLPDAIGRPDPYTYDHAPGVSSYVPYGDGVLPRPQLKLSGLWRYGDGIGALTDMARIEALLPLADGLSWGGLHLIGLLPGSTSLPTIGDTDREVSHMLTLNISTTLTAAMLRDARLRGSAS